MSQQSKPREFLGTTDDHGHFIPLSQVESWMKDAWPNAVHVVEKSALDIAVAALKKIHEEDKNPYNHNINGPEKCAICIAKEALKTLGVRYE